MSFLKNVPTLVATADIAYDTDIPGSPTGIICNAAGGLTVVDVEGNERLFTVIAGNLPWRLDLRIRKIKGNGSAAAGDGTLAGGTDIALASCIVLH